MNWYKISQQYRPAPIVITSYDQAGELGISFNGGPTYTYYNVSPYWMEKIRTLLRYRNYKAVNKALKNFSNKEKQQNMTNNSS
ncbi:MAG: hypothetical protein ACTSSP_02810 [Candidatus Asgardarchaeia archaeon]